MGYYIRVLGKTNPIITVDQLTATLRSENLKALIEIDDGTPEDWTQLLVKDKNDRDILLIEKNEVIDGELGQAEINEFKDEVADYKPSSATKWLVDYFDKVKVIYAFQVLSTVDNDKNWSIVSELKSKIWNETGGIMQADNEGFSNEEGYHILWQFSDNVTGPWHMAVLDPANNWVKFKMNLGDKKQREEFFEGRVPKGSELV
ncbi:MAG: hypothetical protein U0U09_12410 [Cyclobacteriaceae bacterium]